MNWLKTLWNWFITPSADDCCDVVPVEVEEDSELLGELLVPILRDMGVTTREIKILDIVAKFDEWYDGPLTTKAILIAWPTFRETYQIKFGFEV
jgi:hypothetical protein